MVNKFNNTDGGLIKIGNAKRMGGYVLDRPDLIFGGNKSVACPFYGYFNDSDKIFRVGYE